MAGYAIQLFIGPYFFYADNAPLEKLSRNSSYRWPSQQRLTRPPATQFVGAGDETISVNGYIHPHEPKCGGSNALTLDILRTLADAGVPYTVITGTGHVFGQFVIVSIKDDFSGLMDDLRPRRVDFSVELKRYGADQ